MGAYKDRIEKDRERRGISPGHPSIAVAKNTRTKARNAQRKVDNIKRHAEYAAKNAKLTPQERLEVLDKRLGVGVGAKSERKKLSEQIVKQAQKE